MRTILLAGIALLTGLSAQASLPPYGDSVVRIQTVLNARPLAGAGPIVRIALTTPLQYDVATANCTVQVRLRPIPPADGLVGPTSYVVESISPGNCHWNAAPSFDDTYDDSIIRLRMILDQPPSAGNRALHRLVETAPLRYLVATDECSAEIQFKVSLPPPSAPGRPMYAIESIAPATCPPAR